ncbi:lipid-A-disaccharide kinase [Modicisalibacter ilicicola DSM 19980]|uniref:Tetraacyldisaccharide 4'-kinase n=1 Tax=Modicisalibacter ilicicola DSM 19980 TaxID=1121942 RepID=A0A1M5CC21_9GAMM|nr:tetraacyldisaccharide 4'-kinase [Halomonas ilicicola]SHF52269.1 lipid-A-disaccharide kinase [Halomonas ilicicola DSM 19980]
MSRWVDAGYRDAGWLKALRPVEWLYRRAVARRRQAYATGRKTVQRLPVPVIVVGNITLGGTGKSPLVAWLGRWLHERGWHPGIVSRGYGGRAPHYPFHVAIDSPVAHAGDEPLMLAQQSGLPVVVDPDRPRGARALIDIGCDIVIADDGLQHLALGRDIELVVVDGQRGVGNARCLPAGPLREPLSRLAEVDALVVNGEPSEALPRSGYGMQLRPSRWRHLLDGVCYPVEQRPFSSPVHALAGIGHPARFFATLEALGLEIEAHPLADHHRFGAADLVFGDDRPVVMTAKDAVKCRSFAHARCWVLDVEARPEPAFGDWLQRRLETLQSAKGEVCDG